jgi:hypothetical protein
MISKIIFFLAILILLPEISYSDKNILTYFPIISYTSENSLIYGVYINKTFPKTKKNRFPTSLQILTVNTSKKQLLLYLTPDIHFKGGKYNVKFNIRFFKWNEYYYGIGNNTLNEGKELIKNHDFNCYLKILSSFSKKYYFGYIRERCIRNLFKIFFQ